MKKIFLSLLVQGIFFTGANATNNISKIAKENLCEYKGSGLKPTKKEVKDASIKMAKEINAATLHINDISKELKEYAKIINKALEGKKTIPSSVLEKIVALFENFSRYGNSEVSASQSIVNMSIIAEFRQMHEKGGPSDDCEILLDYANNKGILTDLEITQYLPNEDLKKLGDFYKQYTTLIGNLGAFYNCTYQMRQNKASKGLKSILDGYGVNCIIGLDMVPPNEKEKEFIPEDSRKILINEITKVKGKKYIESALTKVLYFCKENQIRIKVSTDPKLIKL